MLIFLIIIIGMPFYFYSIYIGSKWLRENDEKKWEETGRYTFFLNNSIGSGFKFHRWLMQNKHQSIESKRIVRHLSFAKYFSLVGYVFLGMLLLFPFL